MKRVLTFFLILLFIPLTSPADICGYKEKCKVSFIRDGARISTFESGIAETNESRSMGLMYCPFMEKGKGLLFIFDEAGPKSFWMKNTMIHLGIVFISEDFKVLSIFEGVPFSLDHLTVRGEVKYVLEINIAESPSIRVFDQVKIDFNQINKKNK